MLFAAISRANLAEPRVVHRLDGDAREPRLTAKLRRVGEQERTAAIVQQPLGRRAGLDRVVRQPVRLEMILLRVVHRHEQPLRDARARRADRRSNSGDDARARSHETHHRRSSWVGGIPLFDQTRARDAPAARARSADMRESCARDAPPRRPSSPLRAKKRAHSSSACGASGESFSCSTNPLPERDGRGIVPQRRVDAAPRCSSSSDRTGGV